MPRAPKKTKKQTRNPWTPADLKALRKRAGRTTVRKIARELRRTDGALRQKASSLGISLRQR